MRGGISPVRLPAVKETEKIGVALLSFFVFKKMNIMNQVIKWN